MIRLKKILSLISVSAAILTSAAAGQPTQVSYQGQLKAGGSLYTGTANMKFAILDGSISLWSNDSTSVNGSEPATSVSVAVSGGLFTVQLGALPMKALTAAVFSAAQTPVLRVWASTGGPFEQLTPDQPVSSVPFALQNQSGGSWAENGGNVYRLNGNVGIGTASPGARLDVAGEIRGMATTQFAFKALNTSGQRIFGVETYNAGDPSGNMRVFDHTGYEAIRLSSALSTNSWIAPGTPSAPAQFSIGTDGSHAAQLNVYQSSNTNYAAVFKNGGGNGRGVAIEGGSSGAAVPLLWVGDYTGTNSTLYVRGDHRVGIGTASPNSALEVAGTTTTQVLAITGGDLAEPFSVVSSEKPDPGTLLVIDGASPGCLAVSRAAYDPRVAGVVSGAGGIMTGIKMYRAGASEGAVEVALSGRVYVRATSANGRITPGDLLTSANVPGYAMKASDLTRARGAVIGKAMSRLESGEGLVLLLVQPQ